MKKITVQPIKKVKYMEVNVMIDSIKYYISELSEQGYFYNFSGAIEFED